MNIKDIDPKIIGTVLRAYSETVSKHSQHDTIEALKSTGMSQALINKILAYSRDHGHSSRFEVILSEFEAGGINFEDMAVALLKSSMDIMARMSEELSDIIYLNGEKTQGLVP